MSDLTFADLAGTSTRVIRGKVSYREAARKSSTAPNVAMYNPYVPAELGVRRHQPSLAQPVL